jgi:hypothetical protein
MQLSWPSKCDVSLLLSFVGNKVKSQRDFLAGMKRAASIEFCEKAENRIFWWDKGFILEVLKFFAVPFSGQTFF